MHCRLFFMSRYSVIVVLIPLSATAIFKGPENFGSMSFEPHPLIIVILRHYYRVLICNQFLSILLLIFVQYTYTHTHTLIII